MATDPAVSGLGQAVDGVRSYLINQSIIIPVVNSWYYCKEYTSTLMYVVYTINASILLYNSTAVFVVKKCFVHRTVFLKEGVGVFRSFFFCYLLFFRLS